MKFEAFERTVQGTGASRRMRKNGRVPAIVYGGKEEAKSIELDHNGVWYALKKEAFHSSILDMEIDGKSSRVLLRDVQYHPFKQAVLHLDFQRVSATEKMNFKVPLHFTNEELSEAVKIDRCVVNHVMTEVEVSCLPKDLPEFLEVNLTELKKGGSIHASELVLPKNVVLIQHGQDDPVLASTLAVKEEKEAPTDASPADGDAATEPAAE